MKKGVEKKPGNSTVPLHCILSVVWAFSRRAVQEPPASATGKIPGDCKMGEESAPGIFTLADYTNKLQINPVIFWQITV